MDIIEEETGELTKKIIINLTDKDYKEVVEKKITEYKKKAQIPGFRPGLTPVSIIKKQYGSYIITKEASKILQKELNDYIIKSKLKLLGQPIPIKNEKNKYDSINYPKISFYFEIGLEPEFNLKLENNKFIYYNLEIDQELQNKYIADLTRRNGEVKSLKKAGPEDMLFGKLEGLTEEEIKFDITILLEEVENEDEKKRLLELNKKNSINIDIEKINKGNENISKMLNVSIEEVKEILSKNKEFKFTLYDICQIIPAKIDQSFFDLLFGKNNIKSKEEFEQKIKDELSKNFASDSDFLLMKNIKDELIAKLKLKLPNDFLKKWLKETDQEGKLTDKILEKEYEIYAKELKWELISKKIAINYNIKITEEELLNYTIKIVKTKLEQNNKITGLMLENYAKQVLEKDKNRIYSLLFKERLTEVLKQNVKIKNKTVTFDEFIEIATGKKNKKGILSNIGNIFKNKKNE